MLVRDLFWCVSAVAAEEDADGWDVVQRPTLWGLAALAHSGGAASSSIMPGPGDEGLGFSGPLPFLPPPPSRPGDVLQYERALFTDAHSGEVGGVGGAGLGLGLGSLGLGAGGGGAGAFLRPAALAAEKLPGRLRQQLQSWARRG